jgi:hypothetical protein
MKNGLRSTPGGSGKGFSNAFFRGWGPRTGDACVAPTCRCHPDKSRQNPPPTRRSGRAAALRPRAGTVCRPHPRTGHRARHFRLLGKTGNTVGVAQLATTPTTRLLSDNRGTSLAWSLLKSTSTCCGSQSIRSWTSASASLPAIGLGSGSGEIWTDALQGLPGKVRRAGSGLQRAAFGRKPGVPFRESIKSPDEKIRQFRTKVLGHTRR